MSAHVLKNTGESAHALHILLSMLWKTEVAGYFHLYRMAAVAFADLSLDCGMETEGLKVMESILAQVIHRGLPWTHLTDHADHQW